MSPGNHLVHIICYVAVRKNESHYGRHGFIEGIAIKRSLTALFESIYNFDFTFLHLFKYFYLNGNTNSPEGINPCIVDS